MKPLRVLSVAGLALAASFSVSSGQQVVSESLDLSVAQKIRDEGMNHSKLDDLATYLTDVIGARLTNSPSSRKANDWAAQTFK
jgi:carboxypeptidase Q